MITLITMRRYILQVLGSILGVYLSAKFIPGIDFVGPLKIFILSGLVIGTAIYFIKPILNLILFPLRILTLGGITLIIDVGIIWFVTSIIFHSYFFIKSTSSFLLFTLLIYFVCFFLDFLETPIRKIH